MVSTGAVVSLRYSPATMPISNTLPASGARTTTCRLRVSRLRSEQFERLQRLRARRLRPARRLPRQFDGGLRLFESALGVETSFCAMESCSKRVGRAVVIGLRFDERGVGLRQRGVGLRDRDSDCRVGRRRGVRFGAFKHEHRLARAPRCRRV